MASFASEEYAFPTFVEGLLHVVSEIYFVSPLIPQFVKRARDSGVGGIVYVTWVVVTPDEGPPPSVIYVGPLVDPVVYKIG